VREAPPAKRGLAYIAMRPEKGTGHRHWE